MRIGRVPAGDPLNGRLEGIEAAFHDLRSKLGAEAGGQRRLVHDDAAAGLLDRGDDRIDVERQERPEVDDLGVHPGLLGRGQGDMNHRPVAKDGDALALAPHRRFAERDDIAPFRNFAQRMLRPWDRRLVRMAGERSVIEALRLEEDDRIVVLDRGDQETLGVVRIGRHDRLQPAHMGEQRLRTLAVRLPAVNPAAAGHADDHRGEELPA